MAGQLTGSLAIFSTLSISHGIGIRPELLHAPVARFAKQHHVQDPNGYFVDCQMTPWMCEAPFDCIEAQENISDLWRTRWKVATWDGRANPRSWCTDDTFWTSTVKECLVNKQPKKAALAKLSVQLARGADDEDAKWCFLEKHCNNDEVTEQTTPEEAEAICTKRYGERWKKTGMQDFYSGLKNDAHNYSYLFGEAGTARSFRKAAAKSRIACAQGSFHCDVVYCKETYCQNPTFRGLYSQYLKWDTGKWKYITASKQPQGEDVDSDAAKPPLGEDADS